MPSTTRGSILISTANDIGSTLVDKLGGDGYTPEEWDSAANLCGIASADIATALSNIQESTPGGADRGSISIAKANSIGRILNKKFDTSRGFKPSEWASAIDKLTPLEIKTASGAIASFADGADGVPVKSCSVSFVASGGGGTPSAPVAIQGVSGLSVTQLGKNLMSASPVLTDNRYICYWGNHSASGANDGVFLKAGTYTITFTKPSSMETANFCVYGAYVEDKTQITIISNTRNNPLSNQITVQKDGRLNFWIYGTANEITSADVPLITCQIEVGSTATTYSAYMTPSVVTDTFGQTIYGGTRDLTTDKASVTYALLELAVADMNNSDNYPGWRDCGIKALIGADKGSISGFYVSVGNALGVNTNGSNDICFLPKASYGNMTQTEWKTNYPNLVIQIVVPLATPTEITGLTPHEIDTLYGDNNIYSDTGTTTVEYRADIDLALNA